MLKRLWIQRWIPWGQETSIANARAASLELARARVERDEVDLYLARLVERPKRVRSA